MTRCKCPLKRFWRGIKSSRFNPFRRWSGRTPDITGKCKLNYFNNSDQYLTTNKWPGVNRPYSNHISGNLFPSDCSDRILHSFLPTFSRHVNKPDVVYRKPETRLCCCKEQVERKMTIYCRSKHLWVLRQKKPHITAFLRFCHFLIRCNMMNIIYTDHFPHLCRSYQSYRRKSSSCWTRYAVKDFLPLVTENESALINPVNKPVTTPRGPAAIKRPFRGSLLWSYLTWWCSTLCLLGCPDNEVSLLSPGQT